MTEKKRVDWAKIRRAWESEPDLSKSDCARRFGVSRARLTTTSNDENWTKVLVTPSMQAEAERRAQGEERQQIAATPTHDVITIDEAINRRAEVLHRHRMEWNAPRNIIYEAMKEKDFDKAKLGKISAETLFIIQRAERKAHGIEDVVVHRHTIHEEVVFDL